MSFSDDDTHDETGLERMKVTREEFDKMLAEARRVAKEVSEHLRAIRRGNPEQHLERRRKASPPR